MTKPSYLLSITHLGAATASLHGGRSQLPHRAPFFSPPSAIWCVDNGTTLKSSDPVAPRWMFAEEDVSE